MISIQSEISYSLLNKILMLCHQHVMHFSANKRSNLQYLIFKKANIPRPILPDPAECGYEMSDIGLKPILMTKDQIPNSVLKKLSCNCTTNCKNNRCGCRKLGLSCNLHFGCTKSCNFVSCNNSPIFLKLLIMIIRLNLIQKI